MATETKKRMGYFAKLKEINGSMWEDTEGTPPAANEGTPEAGRQGTPEPGQLKRNDLTEGERPELIPRERPPGSLGIPDVDPDTCPQCGKMLFGRGAVARCFSCGYSECNKG